MTMMKTKKAKVTKKYFMKRKLKFEDYKHCLKAHLENKVNHLEKKNTVDVVSLQENHEEFIRNNKLILKLQQKFRSKKNVFTEEVNKIALSPNNDKRIQSVDSVETYTSKTNEEIIHKKEENKCNNIIKKYKK